MKSTEIPRSLQVARVTPSSKPRVGLYHPSLNASDVGNALAVAPEIRHALTMTTICPHPSNLHPRDYPLEEITMP